MSRRTEDKRIQDRQRIASLMLEGKKQSEIAQAVGLSLPTTRKDIHAIRDEWRYGALDDIQEHVNRELAQLDKVITEAWTCYRMAEIAHKARYLQIIINALERQDRVLGVEKWRLDITSDDKPIQPEITLEQRLAQIVAIVNRAQERDK